MKIKKYITIFLLILFIKFSSMVDEEYDFNLHEKQ